MVAWWPPAPTQSLARHPAICLFSLGGRWCMIGARAAEGSNMPNMPTPFRPMLAAFAALILPLPGAAQTGPNPPPYRDTSLSAEARAADLVSRMTLEEKAPQLLNDAPAIP